MKMEALKRKAMELYVRGRVRLYEGWEHFKKEEKGASHMVEIVVVIVIVIAVATIFRDALQEFVTTIMKKLGDFVNS